MEKRAFAAMKGLFDDGQGNFTARRKPDKEYAAELLSGEQYFDGKARIMAPLQRFMRAMDARIDRELAADRSLLRRYIFQALSLTCAALLLVLLSTAYGLRAVLHPIEHLRGRVAEIANGNYGARCRRVSNNEIGDLCAHFNSMAGALESDIAERRLAESALRESHQKFQGLVETLSDWVWEVDDHGRYTYASPQIRGILGYRPEEVLGRTPYDFMPSEEAARVSEAFAALIAERKPIPSLENINLHKDGHEVVLETTGLPFYGADGNLKGYRGTDRDITGRRRAEEELRRSEEKFAKAFRTSPYAILITRLEDGTILEVNDAFLSMTGHARDDVIGRTTIEIKLWAHETDRMGIVKSLGEDHPVIANEFQFQKKSGESLIGLFSTQTIQLRQGPCILSSIDDITERRRAVEELRNNRRFLSELIEHSGALICVKDLDGRYRLVNRQWETVTGWKRQDVFGRTDEELFPGLIGKQFRMNDREVLESGSTMEREEILEDAGVKRYFLSIKFPLCRDDGTIDGLCGMITEITRRKKAEEEREKTIDQLQKALAEIKTLKGIVPICANCKKIRDDKGFWERVEDYVAKHTDAEFSHGICPECIKKPYPGMELGPDGN